MRVQEVDQEQRTSFIVVSVEAASSTVCGLKLANVRRRCIVSGIVRVRLTVESPPPIPGCFAASSCAAVAPEPKTQKFVRQQSDNSQTAANDGQTTVRQLQDLRQKRYFENSHTHHSSFVTM
jgi:hypothetical protein